jgi:3-deoxy-D-manno-octulosonic-acid transferase
MSFPRATYTAIASLALPFIPFRLWWRGRREPGYRQHIGERFGRYEENGRPVDIWLHAVSAGETRAAAPLVAALRKRYPEALILLTHMTATGREAGRGIFGDTVAQAFLPYDYPFAVRRFLRHFSPRIGIVMETELWPNLVAGGRAAGVPIYLVNARLSQRSADGYARFRRLATETISALAGVGAQTDDDGRRLQALGASPVRVTGNLKFDVAVPQAMLELGRRLREQFGCRRPVWVAASTREGEEQLLLAAISRLPAEVLTVIVPRHPQRFDEVASLVRESGLPLQRRSEDREVSPETRVVLGDSMGEMFAYCAAADLAFVGGSLLPLGGQNLLEACAVGTPVLVGPHTFNFAEATEGALNAGAALRVADAAELSTSVVALLADTPSRQRMSSAGRAFFAAHGGATERTLELLEPALAGLSRSTADG